MDELRAFLFGITVAIAIGPIAILILNIGINRGFWLAARCAAGAASADFTYSVIALSIGTVLVAALNEYEIMFRAIASLVLIVLGAWMAIRALRATGETRVADSHDRFGFVTLYLLTLVNPLTILIFLGFSGQLAFSGGFTQILMLSFFIFAGSLLIQIVLAAGGAIVGRLLRNPKVVRQLNIASGVLITGFGVYGIARLI